MKPEGLSVESAVSKTEREPIVVLTVGGEQAILSVGQARKVAADIVQQAARSEADAMIYKFFDKKNFPPGAAEGLMYEFRVFRHQLDTEAVEGQVLTPSFDPPTQ